MKIKRFPNTITKKTKQWVKDLDDLIGNYDMFCEKWDVDERYDWFDVIYNFMYVNLEKKIDDRSKGKYENSNQTQSNQKTTYKIL